MNQLNAVVIPTKTSATTNSSAVYAANLFNISVQAVSTSDAVGVCKLQASNDNPLDSSAPTHWSDIPGATVDVNTGGGSFLIPKTDICYEYIRVVYTRTSGTGTIMVQIKAIGA